MNTTGKLYNVKVCAYTFGSPLNWRKFKYLLNRVGLSNTHVLQVDMAHNKRPLEKEKFEDEAKQKQRKMDINLVDINSKLV